MKIPCGIIKDLLPLYHDGVVTFETQTAVEEHLASCRSCREEYAKLCGSDYIERNAFDENKAESLAASYKHLKRRAVGRIILFVLLGILALGAIYLGVKLYRRWPVYPSPMKSVQTAAELREEMKKAGFDLLYPRSEDIMKAGGYVSRSVDLDGRSRYAKAENYTVSWVIQKDTQIRCSVFADPNSKVRIKDGNEIKGVPVQKKVYTSTEDKYHGIEYRFEYGGCLYTVRGDFRSRFIDDETVEEYKELLDRSLTSVIEGMLP